MSSEVVDKQDAGPESREGTSLKSSPPDAGTMLLEFVKGRDVECPQCGYNLRNLTKPICPECREDLTLSVGLVKVRFGLFVVALIPGAFSSICAFILAIPMILVPLFGQQPAPIEFVILDGFGWLSGIFAVGLYLSRYRFLRIGRSGQIVWALVLWAIHLLAFAIFMVSVI